MAFSLANPRTSFPDADGFGKFTLGGDHGAVYFITNLNDSGTGSFRQAIVNERYPRLVIPRVAGYVNLASQVLVSGLNSPGSNASGNLTYIGMLAPGNGLVLRHREFRITSLKNFIIRGLKSRYGDSAGFPNDGDSLAMSNADAPNENENFIISNCTFSWGTDETFSVSGINGSVQYCMLSEGLNDSIHSKEAPHSYGGIWGNKNVSFHHNLFAYFNDRNPVFQNSKNLSSPTIDFRNNAIYAWGSRPTRIAFPVNLNLIKNSYYPKGDNSQAFNSPLRFLTFDGNTAGTTGRVYPFGNTMPLIIGLTDDVTSQKQGIGGTTGAITTALRDTVVVNTPFTIHAGTYDFDETVAESDAIIELKVGSPLPRDTHDIRIINEWTTRTVTKVGSVTGILGLIDTPLDGGGYPTLDTTSNPYLTGIAPHYLPSDLLSKYGMSSGYNYTLAGDPETRPERFIIFKGGQGVQLSQYVGSVDYETDWIYNIYRVAEFHVTGEIDLLEGVTPPNPTFALTVVTGSNGVVSSSSGNYEAGTLIPLTATANSGFVFDRWIRLDTNGIVSSNANFTFTMPAIPITLMAEFVSVTPLPPDPDSFKFAARYIEPIV